MVPDKFNMVDMEGIDLLESQGLEIEGLYDKLVESITLCRYTILYNWKFDGVEIPPSYFELEVENNTVSIGDYVSVNSDDILHIYSIQTEANIVPISITENGTFLPPVEIDGYSPVNVQVDPVVQSLEVTENGTYTPPSGVDGYSTVTVSVPVNPVIQSLEVTEDGIYTAPSGVDGYSPVTVNTRVEPVIQPLSVTENGIYTAPSGVDGYSPVNVSIGTRKLYLLSPAILDAIQNASNADRKYPLPYISKINANAGVNFEVAAYQFGSSSKFVLYRYGYQIGGMQVCYKVPAETYSKLNVQLKVEYYGTGWPQAAMTFSSGLGFGSNGIPGSSFRTIYFANNSMTAAQINAQEGVTINSTDPILLSAQTVEVDISGITQDFYIGIWNCDRNIFIREISLE